MKTALLPVAIRVLVCLFGIVCLLNGGFGLVQCFIPTFGTDGEQSALTPMETAIQAAVALFFGCVFILPARFFRSRTAYRLFFVVRCLALLPVVYLVCTVQFTEQADALSYCIVFLVSAFLLLCVASSVWELYHAHTPIHSA